MNDSDAWINAEIHFVKEALKRDIPVLGTCFGAQLLANALGASVVSGSTFEIGMLPVSLTEWGRPDPVFNSMPQVFPVFQWHGEGMALSHGCAHLAASADFRSRLFG